MEMSDALNDLIKSIEGVVVMSIELEDLFQCIYQGRVPTRWQRVRETIDFAL